MGYESINTEPIRARGIIVLAKSNWLVKKISTKNLSLVKARLKYFLLPKHYKYGGRFSLLVGYNTQPTSSSTNQNAALMIDHQFDFTENRYASFFKRMPLQNGYSVVAPTRPLLFVFPVTNGIPFFKCFPARLRMTPVNKAISMLQIVAQFLFNSAFEA